MGTKFQRYVAIVVIALVVILIAIKLVFNYKMKQVKWEEGDRQALIETCIDDLGGRAVRFPLLTQEYCECTTDTLMAHYEKYEYLEMEAKPYEEKSKEMTPIIMDCYNTYNAGMFDNSRMPD